MSGGDFPKEINATTNIRNRINFSGLQFFSSFLLVKISSIKIAKIKPFLVMISFWFGDDGSGVYGRTQFIKD